MSIRLSRSATESLRNDGYCRFKVDDIAPASGFNGSIARLQAAVENLPADPHAPTANRYRRYSNAILLPWCRKLEWMPNRQAPTGPYTEYYQEAEFNPEFPAMVRRMPPLEDWLKHDALLHDIIWHDFDLTFWTEVQLIRPFVVGVHFVKLLAAEPGSRAVSSPNHLHQDGEPFTFVHLVARENAVGATTVVADPSCSGSMPEDVDGAKVHAVFELQEPLESYGVHDMAVSHYVSALEHGPEDQPGVRAALLIDFTPLVPVI
jgi:hypothetical protein